MKRPPHPAKALIVGKGLTQLEVARAVGLAPSAFSRALNGHLTPWPALRRRVADYLGVTEAEAWNLDDEDVPA